MKKQGKTIILLVLALLVVIFSVLNVEPIGINFGFRVIEIPLAIILIGTLLIGALITFILSTTVLFKNKNDYKKLKEENSKLKKDYQIKIDKLNKKHQKELNKLNQKLITMQEEKKEIKN